jgi:hypothetical protein
MPEVERTAYSAHGGKGDGVRSHRERRASQGGIFEDVVAEMRQSVKMLVRWRRSWQFSRRGRITLLPHSLGVQSCSRSLACFFACEQLEQTQQP